MDARPAPTRQEFPPAHGPKTRSETLAIRLTYVAMATSPIDHNAMSFGEHLEELRRRLIVSLLGLIPILIVSFIFGKPLLGFILIPAEQALLSAGLPPMLQATGVLETFGSYMRIAFAVAIVVASPWLLWQLWVFVAPGLYDRERRFIYVLAPLSSVLTITGAFFLYKLMLPIVLAFFISFGTSVGARPVATIDLAPGVTLPEIPVLDGDPRGVEPGRMWFNTRLNQLRVSIGRRADGTLIIAGAPFHRTTGIAQQYKVSEYTKLVLALTLAFVIAFQTPVVVLLLGWSGIIDKHFLDGKRKIIVMVSAVLGAVLTPADPISMILMGGALYGLFEFGVLLMRLLPAERVAGPAEPPDAGDE